MDYEAIQMRHFLGTLGPEDGVALPILSEQVVWGERPDVRLHLPEGIIGVELTLAADEEKIRAFNLFTDGKTQGVTTDSGIYDGPVRRTDEQLIDHMQNTHGMQWDNVADVAIRIVKKFCERLNRKVNRAGQPGYERFAHNWLFMSDPTQVIGNKFQAGIVGEQLTKIIENHSFSGCPFDLIILQFPDGYYKIRVIDDGQNLTRALNGYDMTRTLKDNVVGELPQR